MPKVIINDSQGLVQQSGSGVEVSSTISMSGAVSMSSTFSGAKVELVQATTVLTLADSGKVLVPTGTAKTITLPAVATASGFNVTFMAGSAANHIITGGGAKIQGAIFDNTNATTLARNAVSNGTTITLANGSVGDYLTIVGDGTNYYVFGWCNDTPTIA